MIDASIPSAFLVQIVIPESSDGGWMAAKASTTLAHRTVKKRNSAPSHISFTRCLAVSTVPKPAVHAVGIRRKTNQHLVVSWHLNTRGRLHRQLDQSDMPFDDVYRTFCSPVGLRVTFSGCFWHNITSPGQLHRPELCKAPKHHSVVSQSVQILNNHLHHLLTAWEIN